MKMFWIRLCGWIVQLCEHRKDGHCKACMMVCDMNLNSQRTGRAVKAWQDKGGGQCGQGWLGGRDTAEWPVSICPLGSYSLEPVT